MTAQHIYNYDLIGLCLIRESLCLLGNTESHTIQNFKILIIEYVANTALFA